MEMNIVWNKSRACYEHVPLPPPLTVAYVVVQCYCMGLSGQHTEKPNLLMFCMNILLTSLRVNAAWKNAQSYCMGGQEILLRAQLRERGYIQC